MTEAQCVFCDIIAGAAPAEIVDRGRYAMTIVPLNPVTPGHTITIPYLHVSDATSHPAVTSDTMFEASRIAARHPASNIITSVGADATQSVFHLHIHVVPRVAGDGLTLPWSEPGDPAVKEWSCLTCGEPIRVNPHAGLGEPRYVHSVPAGHLALRGPDQKSPERSHRFGCDPQLCRGVVKHYRTMGPCKCPCHGSGDPS